MSKYISKTTKGFYDSEDSENLPKDAVEISDEVYEQLKAADARLISFDEKGFPSLQESYVIDPELLKITEKEWRNSELLKADIEINKIEDGDTKAVGEISQWREYRKKLRDWPEAKKFPDIKYRPKLSG